MKKTLLSLFLFNAILYAQSLQPSPIPAGGGGGGSSVTIPSTANILKGDGAGNGADAGFTPLVVANGTIAYCADAGSNDTYACSLAPVPAGYVTGALYRFKANTTNTGTATINFNSLGAKTIVKVAGGITTALADNDIRVGQVVELSYDGTNMQMQSTSGNVPGAPPAGSTHAIQGNGGSGAFEAVTFTGDVSNLLQALTVISLNGGGTATGHASLDLPLTGGTLSGTLNGTSAVFTGSIGSGNGSGVGGLLYCAQGTLPPSFQANSFTLFCPTSIGTAYQWRVPTADAAGAIVSDGAGSPGVLSIVAFSGTGNIAKVTSPAFTAPNLGTPSALVLTNATGLPGPATANALMCASAAGVLKECNTNNSTGPGLRLTGGLQLAFTSSSNYGIDIGVADNRLALAAGATNAITGITWTAGANPAAGQDLGVFRAAAKVATLADGNTSNSLGSWRAASYQSGGTKFTISGCSAGTTVGGATAGTFASGTTGACTVVITMNGATGITAPNGWSCNADDLTTPANLISQSASSTTTCTVTGTTVSGDTISFMAIAF